MSPVIFNLRFYFFSVLLCYYYVIKILLEFHIKIERKYWAQLIKALCVASVIVFNLRDVNTVLSVLLLSAVDVNEHSHLLLLRTFIRQIILYSISLCHIIGSWSSDLSAADGIESPWQLVWRIGIYREIHVAQRKCSMSLAYHYTERQV